MSERFRPQYNAEGLPVPDYMVVPEHVKKEVDAAIRKRMDKMPSYEDQNKISETPENPESDNK